MENKKNTKVIVFGNQKGGVGKSTLTSLFANYLHIDTDEIICVVDADDKQMSLQNTRKKEITEGADDEKLYNLIQINSIDFPSTYENSLKGEFDYIFVDLPGNLKQPGVLDTFIYTDYLFIPTSLSSFDLDSMSIFVDLYDDVIKKRKEIKIILHNKSGSIEVQVVNSGPRLPEDMLDELFNSMVSIRSERSDTGPHLGLG